MQASELEVGAMLYWSGGYIVECAGYNDALARMRLGVEYYWVRPADLRPLTAEESAKERRRNETEILNP